MTTITHGKIAPVLADGTSLLQHLVLTEEQSRSVTHDLAVLTKDRSARFHARMLNIGGRALSVALLLGLSALIVTNSVHLILAGVIAAVMLFATDALNVVDRKLSERRHNKLKTLQFANTVFAMTRSHTFNKTLDEKTAYYFDLIRTGEAGVGTSKSHRLRLVTSGKEQVLRHVVLP